MTFYRNKASVALSRDIRSCAALRCEHPAYPLTDSPFARPVVTSPTIKLLQIDQLTGRVGAPWRPLAPAAPPPPPTQRNYGRTTRTRKAAPGCSTRNTGVSVRESETTGRRGGWRSIASRRSRSCYETARERHGDGTRRVNESAPRRRRRRTTPPRRHDGELPLAARTFARATRAASSSLKFAQ